MQLTLDRLTKRYGGRTALDGVSTSFQPGIYGLLGPNGAGKTTMMRLICGVLRPTSGAVRLDGTDVRALGERYRGLLGYLPQDFGCYPNFTAMDFLLYMSALKGLSAGYAREKSVRLLETVGLPGEGGRKIRTFSGGMKRRLGIAQALLNDPQILILDEPTAGLDPKERVRFRNLISALGEGRIVLLSTHIVTDVEYIADEILVLREGALVRKGTEADILAEIEGCVWECHVTRQEAHRIVETCSVCNSRGEGDSVALRVVSPHRPCEGAVPAAPCLEDLYLHYFHGEVE